MLGLHYTTAHTLAVRHEIYRLLFYIPLIFATFWFGFWGAVATSVTIFLLYLPHAVDQWDGLSLTYRQVLEGGLFLLIALILGYLAETKRREHQARLSAEKLASLEMALSWIPHDTKLPPVAIGVSAAQGQRKLVENDRVMRGAEGELGISLEEAFNPTIPNCTLDKDRFRGITFQVSLPLKNKRNFQAGIPERKE